MRNVKEQLKYDSNNSTFAEPQKQDHLMYILLLLVAAY